MYFTKTFCILFLKRCNIDNRAVGIAPFQTSSHFKMVYTKCLALLDGQGAVASPARLNIYDL